MKRADIPPKTAFTISAGFQCLELFYKKNVDLYLCYCGIEDCSRGHSFGPAVRKDYLIHYVTKGRGIYQVGNVTHELKQGDFFLICPGVTTFYRADEEEPWSYIWVGFNGIKASVYLDYLHLDDQVLTGHCDQVHLLEDIVSQMLVAKALTYANELQREGLLYQFLSVLSRSAEGEGGDTEREGEYPYSVYVEHVLRYMEENYASEIRISALADDMGLSRSYLSNCFKQVVGESIKEYLVRLRMEKAEQLLLDTNEPVQEIARRVGYEDALAFSKVFKKKNAVSPSAYRKDREELQVENRF